jgi:hypothetical protein
MKPTKEIMHLSSQFADRESPKIIHPGLVLTGANDKFG